MGTRLSGGYAKPVPGKNEWMFCQSVGRGGPDGIQQSPGGLSLLSPSASVGLKPPWLTLQTMQTCGMHHHRFEIVNIWLTDTSFYSLGLPLFSD